MTATTPPDEAALVERLRAGDEAAFERIVTCYHGPLLRLAQAHVASRAIAEEVVQDTFLAVMEGLHAFEGRSSFRSWIFRILSNRAKTRGVREARSAPFSALAAEGAGDEPAVAPERFDARGRWAAPPRSWEGVSPESLVADREIRVQVERAIEELPEAQRAVITLRDIEGLEGPEVCAILDLTEANQRVLLHRARARIRARLEVAMGGR